MSRAYAKKRWLCSSPCFFLFLSLAFLLPYFTNANALGIVINEIAWMGSATSPNNEWLELYNSSETPINLNGWQLVALDGTPIIELTGEVQSKGFFLLERTDDETVPGITADLIYKGSLKNEGEHLKLIDNQGITVDEIDCSTGWFAGDNTTKQTMERKFGVRPGSDPSGWQTSQEPGGTPKAVNSQGEMVDSPPLTKSKEWIATSTEPVEPAKTENYESPTSLAEIVYPKNVFINEILPSPEGADAENEWLELFNANDFEVDISGWQIRDTAGATKTYTFPEGTKIAPKDFLLLPRPQTKITLQNKGDGLEILNPKGESVHQVNYDKAPKGQSYNRFSSGWSWSMKLTPGNKNINTPPQAPEIGSPAPTRSASGASDEAKGQSPSLEENTLAKIGETSSISPNHLLTLLAAFIIAIGSAVVVLILKKSAKTEN